MHQFDVIISVGVKDVFIVRKVVKYVAKNISPNNIYLITNRRFFKFYSSSFISSYHVTLLDESRLVEGMNIQHVCQLVNQHFVNGMRGGWYFQQFLKMAFALSPYAGSHYLIWDADTIPTSSISFFDEDGKMLIAQKEEYNPPYFETMNRLIGMGKSVEFSFIAEHMMIKTIYMRELLNKISESTVNGTVWYEKIINATNPNTGLAFSEFETYGTYVWNTHPADFAFRSLHTMRKAGFLFGRAMTTREIDYFDGVTDTISLEADHIPTFPRNIYQYCQLAFLRLLKP